MQFKSQSLFLSLFLTMNVCTPKTKVETTVVTSVVTVTHTKVVQAAPSTPTTASGYVIELALEPAVAPFPATLQMNQLEFKPSRSAMAVEARTDDGQFLLSFQYSHVNSCVAASQNATRIIYDFAKCYAVNPRAPQAIISLSHINPSTRSESARFVGIAGQAVIVAPKHARTVEFNEIAFAPLNSSSASFKVRGIWNDETPVSSGKSLTPSGNCRMIATRSAGSVIVNGTNNFLNQVCVVGGPTNETITCTRYNETGTEVITERYSDKAALVNGGKIWGSLLATQVVEQNNVSGQTRTTDVTLQENKPFKLQTLLNQTRVVDVVFQQWDPQNRPLLGIGNFESCSSRQVQYTYDDATRTVTKAYSGGSGTCSQPYSETFQYDAYGNLVQHVLNRDGKVETTTLVVQTLDQVCL